MARLSWKLFVLSGLILITSSFKLKDPVTSWIRINQLGYLPAGSKVAVWATKNEVLPSTFQLINSQTSKVEFTGKVGKTYGKYGPFRQLLRLNFSSIKAPGNYYLKCGGAISPVFKIGNDVYAGAADFGLRYMRQQRSGFNPYLKDSCHTTDGYTMYGPMPDTTRIDVSGGWHDATDYLQYATTSANATYHLLAAYRDFPEAFSDQHLANGLAGKNGTSDVLDEARWGLEWLLKMHPQKDWLFNQLADDRDHVGFRLPTKDSADYGVGPGKGRPVYFASGQPQGLGKYKNKSTGVASIAGKFASAFALGSFIYQKSDSSLAQTLLSKSLSAYQLGLDKPGVAQTAPNRSPYFYEEDNWTDDMELGSAALYQLTGDKKYQDQSLSYSVEEKITPWMGADTARHYQWYPFHNFGHYELAKKTVGKSKSELFTYYKDGIEKVWIKASENGFFRGIPFIWCSNNLTTSFAIQCYLYREISGDKIYEELEQACIDWLFGCNPWGKSMVYGLPGNGDTPKFPHSSLTLLNQYPLDGGLVDGPVYGSIFRNLKGLKLEREDPYADFQSDYVVYHDDFGDYSTNEPTMDGTASLIYLLAAKQHESKSGVSKKQPQKSHGAIIRGDQTKKRIALVFTGDEYADGGDFICESLKKQNVKGSFFLTGSFYRKIEFQPIIAKLKKNGNYLGSHSDKHLLYCDWQRRDSLLVTKDEFVTDLTNSFKALKTFNISRSEAGYFLPPYEWYNDSIAAWTRESGLTLINFSPGTRSNADYTFPEMGKRYVDSETIYKSIFDFEKQSESGLNGFLLLMHIGTDPGRKDKFYHYLPKLITDLKSQGYQFVKIDEMLL
ncbi:glycoside hydrolase family 9 protein [Dyadobacter sp. CY356]|uniref:glycoside hydrolase family 9 protein n=1 Tax=Dyadobacter sp. CY356 TaxID=2906442 RepID=UPI001F4711C8|nr:glycoside hydrolase family 9 protein [Dyadobacter sp. CY356]MCF0057106.1 glycoside hydrolase family 9 protein [Dyadobacter sp. CY356]